MENSIYRKIVEKFKGKKKQKKVKIGEVLTKIGLGAFLLAFVVYLFVFGDGGYLPRKELNKRIEELSGKVARLEKENSSLKEEISALIKYDPFILEAEARKLGLIKPGEKIIRFKEEVLREAIER